MKQFQIMVPYYPGNIGIAYNQAMKHVDDWVLFLDHDIMILTPDWYEQCRIAIDLLGHEAGWITCMTNSIWCDDQLDIKAPNSNNIAVHLQHARTTAKKFPQIISPGSAKKFLGNIFSGFFILTHKEAWEKAGGFIEEHRVVTHGGINFECNKHLGVDNDYFFRLTEAGYKNYIIQNIYAFHLREVKHRV